MNVNGIEIEQDTKHFLVPTAMDFSELRKLSEFPNLKTISCVDVALDDEGLEALVSASNVDNLCLQGAAVSNAGLAHLAKLGQLTHLRLKDNEQLDDGAIEYLNALTGLEELQIHETNITASGLEKLELPNLTFFVLDRYEKSFESVETFSKRFPGCEVLVKSRGTFRNGVFSGTGW